MKVGIVGSRRFTNKEMIYELVDSLNPDDVVVSGGAIGVDSFAETRAKLKGLKTKIFLPDFAGVRNRIDMINAYYNRNKQIAENSDVIHAFVVDNKGGTWNTIKYAKQLNKTVIIHKDAEV